MGSADIEIIVEMGKYFYAAIKVVGPFLVDPATGADVNAIHISVRSV